MSTVSIIENGICKRCGRKETILSNGYCPRCDDVLFGKPKEPITHERYRIPPEHYVPHPARRKLWC